MRGRHVYRVMSPGRNHLPLAIMNWQMIVQVHVALTLSPAYPWFMGSAQLLTILPESLSPSERD